MPDKPRWRINRNENVYVFDGEGRIDPIVIPLGRRVTKCRCDGDVFEVDTKATWGVCWLCSAEVKL